MYATAFVVNGHIVSYGMIVIFVAGVLCLLYYRNCYLNKKEEERTGIKSKKTSMNLITITNFFAKITSSVRNFLNS